MVYAIMSDSSFSAICWCFLAFLGAILARGVSRVKLFRYDCVVRNMALFWRRVTVYKVGGGVYI